MPRALPNPTAVLMTALVLAGMAGCTQLPTPFGPFTANGGYQEQRVGERVYRVTFQANPATQPGAVLDMALLRSAELTRDAGYAAFVLMGRSAEAKLDSYDRTLPNDDLLMNRRSFFAFPRFETVTYVRYHEVTLLMRMVTAEEQKATPDALGAADLLARLARYRTPEAAR